MKMNAGTRHTLSMLTTGFGKIMGSMEGVAAQVRTANPRPILEVPITAGVEPSEQVLLLRAYMQSDRREYPTHKRTLGLKPDKHTRKVSLKEIPSPFAHYGFKRFQVTPQADLEPGEYIIMIGGAPYDFGVDEE